MKSSTLLIASSVAVLAAAMISVSLWYSIKSATGSTLSKSQNEIKYKVFLTAHGYGYDIIVGNKVKIHQTYIPGVNLKSGFASKEDAEKDCGVGYC
jgi:hypothetical protein